MQEMLYLPSRLDKMGVKCNGPAVIQENNQSWSKMCKNPVMQKRTKHIDIKNHLTRERVEDSMVELQYCKTKEMCTVLLTRNWLKQKHEPHREQLLGRSLTFIGSTD